MGSERLIPGTLLYGFLDDDGFFLRSILAAPRMALLQEHRNGSLYARSSKGYMRPYSGFRTTIWATTAGLMHGQLIFAMA